MTTTNPPSSVPVGRASSGHRLKKLLFLMIFSGIILGLTGGCASTKPKSKPRANKSSAQTPSASVKKDFWVPRWYAELPRLAGCKLAYAHSGIYIDAKLQKAALLENGAANLAKSIQVTMEVERIESQQSSHSQAELNIEEGGWEGQSKALEKELKVIKEFQLPDSILALVGKCSGNADVKELAAALDNTLVNICSDDPPLWVSDILTKQGKVFGVGFAANQLTAAKSWQEAERQARADLAIRLKGQTTVLENTYAGSTGAYTEVISKTHAKATLRNLQVIRHAYSHYSPTFLGPTFYALVRMPSAEH